MLPPTSPPPSTVNSNPSPVALQSAPLPAPRRLARWLWRLHRLLPWASLALGIPGAIVMDRGPKRAALVAVAASSMWVLLSATHWLLRVEVDGEKVGRIRGHLVRVARYSSLLVTQSIVQLCLFFALPFYFRASTLAPGDIDPGHALFMLGLAAVCGVSLWDPWTEWLLCRPLLAPLLPAVSSFIALDTVLPGFGISTQRSLWLAAGSAILSVAWIAGGAAEPGQRLRRGGKAALLALFIPLALLLGAARLLPPVPLRLSHAEFGLVKQGKWIAAPVTSLPTAPERLICATAIASPTGLRDRLFHVWRKDGVEIARMELDIVGGRRDGYRTMSWLQGFGPRPAARYTCSVVTAAGQVLGSRHIRIGETHATR
jgi:hypothetical protein